MQEAVRLLGRRLLIVVDLCLARVGSLNAQVAADETAKQIQARKTPGAFPGVACLPARRGMSDGEDT